MVSIADLASIATSGATCVALVFAGLELQRSRAQVRHRTLLMNFKGGHAALENTSAVICFDDAEGARQQNKWPKRKPQADGQAT